MNIQLHRPFRREGGKARFRATYRVTDVPSPGCVQVAVTLAVRIQLEQEIERRGVVYTESLLHECTKELVRQFVDKGGRLDPDCSPNLSPDPLFIHYGDFDLLADAAVSISAPRD